MFRFSMRARRPSRAWRLAAAATALVVVASASALTVLALTPPNPGPFTGCLAAKTTSGTPATKGQLYNIALSATAPLAPCVKGDTVVTFSNAKGEKGDPGEPGGGTLESLDGVPCDTDFGPGHIITQTASDPTGLGTQNHLETLQFPMTLTCSPTGISAVEITVTPGVTVTVSPTPLAGPADCTWPGGPPQVSCIWYFPAGTPVTLTATPEAGYTLPPQFLWFGLDPSCLGNLTCSFTTVEGAVDGLVLAN